MSSAGGGALNGDAESLHAKARAAAGGALFGSVFANVSVRGDREAWAEAALTADAGAGGGGAALAVRRGVGAGGGWAFLV